MVDLLPLENAEDVFLVKNLLNEFYVKTGSEVADEILRSFNEYREKFVKVFPKEYQRAIRQMKEEQESKKEEKKVPNPQPNNKVKDIEDSVPDETKLDKTRGFMKYKRIKGYYRDAAKRSKDWDEIFDHKYIRQNVRTQAARYE